MSSVPGLKVAPSTAIRTPVTSPPSCSTASSASSVRWPALIASTASISWASTGPPSSLGANGQRPDVLRQAAAAETESGVEELPTDPLVVAEGIGQQHHVAAGGLAHLRHRVDEADLGGQERVRRGLDQLRGGEVAADDGRRLGQRDGVHLLEDLQGAGALHPEHEPVRAKGVLDGEALAQELGVPGDLDRRHRPAPGPAAAAGAEGPCRPARSTCRPPGSAG